MKNRTIAFGYLCQNGQIVINPSEAKTVKKFFADYLNGKSLSAIVNELNCSRIEYMPNVIEWNRSRLSRLLSDERYVGDKRYPALIGNELFGKVQAIKRQKAAEQPVGDTAEVLKIRIPVMCGECNGRLYRNADQRRSCTRWLCRNENCKVSIKKSDTDFLKDIIETLNLPTDHSEIIDIPTNPISESSGKSTKTEEIIEKIFRCENIDREAVRNELMASAAFRYSKIDSTYSQAQLIKDTFAERNRSEIFSNEFLERTTDVIKLYRNGSVGLILETGQEIKRIETNGDIQQ